MKLLFFIIVGLPILISSQELSKLRLKHVWKKELIEKTISENPNIETLQDKDGKSILHHAAIKDTEGNIITYLATTFPKLLEQTDFDGHTPLHFAAFHGNYKAVEVLLSLNANPNALNKSGKTPGHKAVQLGDFNTTCLQYMKVIFAELHNHQANFNLQDYHGNTLLHDAASRGNTAVYYVAHSLIGMNLVLKNHDKYTAAHLFKISQSPILAERFIKNLINKPINATSV